MVPTLCIRVPLGMKNQGKANAPIQSHLFSLNMSPPQIEKTKENKPDDKVYLLMRHDQIIPPCFQIPLASEYSVNVFSMKWDRLCKESRWRIDS